MTSTISSRTRPLTLPRLLAGLGRTPLAPSLVRQHMATEQRHANRWLWVHRLWELIMHTLIALFGIAVLCGGVALVATPAVLAAGLLHIPLCGPAALLHLAGIAGSVAGMCLLLSAVLDVLRTPLGIRSAPGGRSLVKTRAVWQALPLADVRASLPAPVELLVTELEANTPDCAFILHQLVQGTRVVDPVLEVRLGTQTAYVAIWDAQGRVVALA